MLYMIRNLRCTVTIDSVLANYKTQNAFLFTVNAIFRHDYPLAVEPGSTPRPVVQKKKLGEILYLLICSFLPCLSWLLRSRVRKSRRDLRITLYILITLSQKVKLGVEKEVSMEIERLIVEYCCHVKGRETHSWCFIILLIRMYWALI